MKNRILHVKFDHKTVYFKRTYSRLVVITGTLTVLIQPSIINTRQIKANIYSDILVTGRLVSWTSGPLYSDVDISDTGSQDSPYLSFHGGSKVQTDLFSVYQRDTKYRYSLLKCLTVLFYPVV